MIQSNLNENDIHNYPNHHVSTNDLGMPSPELNKHKFSTLKPGSTVSDLQMM